MSRILITVAVNAIPLPAGAVFDHTDVQVTDWTTNAAHMQQGTGEWNLSNNEEDTTAQPPLGDYLGIPFNDAGRMRSELTNRAMTHSQEK